MHHYPSYHGDEVSLRILMLVLYCAVFLGLTGCLRNVKRASASARPDFNEQFSTPHAERFGGGDEGADHAGDNFGPPPKFPQFHGPVRPGQPPETPSEEGADKEKKDGDISALSKPEAQTPGSKSPDSMDELSSLRRPNYTPIADGVNFGVKMGVQSPWCTGGMVAREQDIKDGKWYCVMQTAAHCVGQSKNFQGAIQTDKGFAIRNAYAEVMPGFNFPYNDTALIFFTDGCEEASGTPVLPIAKTPAQAGDAMYVGARWRGVVAGRVQSGPGNTFSFGTGQPISPGDSGAPIVNEQGEVIGVVSGNESDGYGNRNYYQNICSSCTNWTRSRLNSFFNNKLDF